MLLNFQSMKQCVIYIFFFSFDGVWTCMIFWAHFGGFPLCTFHLTYMTWQNRPNWNVQNFMSFPFCTSQCWIAGSAQKWFKSWWQDRTLINVISVSWPIKDQGSQEAFIPVLWSKASHKLCCAWWQCQGEVQMDNAIKMLPNTFY